MVLSCTVNPSVETLSDGAKLCSGDPFILLIALHNTLCICNDVVRMAASERGTDDKIAAELSAAQKEAQAAEDAYRAAEHAREAANKATADARRQQEHRKVEIEIQRIAAKEQEQAAKKAKERIEEERKRAVEAAVAAQLQVSRGTVVLSCLSRH